MPVFNYGAGFRSNPLDAYNEMADIRHKSKLQKLLGDAYNAPVQQRQSALASLLAFDADAGRVVQSDFDARDKMEAEKLGESGRLISGLYRNQNNAQAQTAYMNVRDALQRKLGFPLPQELDAGTADILGRLGSGGKPAQQQYAEWLLSQAPADQRDQVLGVLAGYKARPSGASLIYKDGEDEYGNPITRVFDPNNVGGQVIGTGQTYGAPVGTGMRGGQSQNVPAGNLFASLPANLQVTSGLRTPERNAQVGGVPNSYHLTGQARDIVPRNPQEDAQTRQWAAQNGMEVIDEGDHLHLEPRPGMQRSMPPQSSGGFMGRRREVEQAKVTAAQEAVKLQYLPAQEQIKAQAAIDQARGVEQAKAGVERDAQAPKRREKFRLVQTSIQNTMNAIDGAIGKVNWATAGPIGAATKGIPGTPAYALAKAALTVKANIGFDRLQQMRDASPTGGALGQVAVQELDALQASIASLDQGLPPDELEANLKTVRRHYQNWLNAVNQAEQADIGGQQPQRPAASGGVDDLLSKYGVK